MSERKAPTVKVQMTLEKRKVLVKQIVEMLKVLAVLPQPDWEEKHGQALVYIRNFLRAALQKPEPDASAPAEPDK